MKDSIVEEVRLFREKHAQRFAYDLDALCEDFQSHQAQFESRLVRFKPKRLQKDHSSSLLKANDTSFFLMHKLQ